MQNCLLMVAVFTRQLSGRGLPAGYKSRQVLKKGEEASKLIAALYRVDGGQRSRFRESSRRY